MDDPLTPRLVLVADDYDNAAQLLAELLEAETPFDGVWAKDGEEAFVIALRRRPIACLLDVTMPVVDGLTAAKAITTAFGPRKPLLIAMSRRDWDDDSEMARVFDHIVRKPVDVQQLLKLFNHL